ncbi:hypothetical protein [Streptomyces tauricus]
MSVKDENKNEDATDEICPPPVRDDCGRAGVAATLQGHMGGR